MPSKRTLFCLKPTRDVRVTGMTCSHPPEVWRPVTIVVVTYKHRGNNPIKDVIDPHDAGIGMPPRPPCEVRTSAYIGFCKFTEPGFVLVGVGPGFR
jgi:hypothetical protein